MNECGKKNSNTSKGTQNHRIKFSGDSSLKEYANTDYGGDAITRKSTSIFLITLGYSPTSWQSKLVHCVATSTTVAEYYSISDCAKHGL